MYQEPDVQRLDTAYNAIHHTDHYAVDTCTPGGDSHMKWTGMLVVSLRGVNFGFWSRLGGSGQNVIIISHQALV